MIALKSNGIAMDTIRNTMSNDHRQCDALFAEVEKAVTGNVWTRAEPAFSKFSAAMLAHFGAEEDVLFPAFETHTGMRMGPTQVMRSEHAQMRELIEAAGAALAAKDGEDYLGYAETLLIMMQQHNLKEENVLYPMCDSHLAGQIEALAAEIGKSLGGRSDGA